MNKVSGKNGSELQKAFNYFYDMQGLSIQITQGKSQGRVAFKTLCFEKQNYVQVNTGMIFVFKNAYLLGTIKPKGSLESVYLVAFTD